MQVIATFKCVRLECRPPQAFELGDTARVTLVRETLPSTRLSSHAFGTIDMLLCNSRAIEEFEEGVTYQVTFDRVDGDAAATPS